MGVAPRFAQVWHVIKRHPAVSTVLAVMGAVGAYDTFSGQIAQLTDWEAPSLHAIFGHSLAMGSHLLPWWGWIILILVTLNLALLWQRRLAPPSVPKDSSNGGGPTTPAARWENDPGVDDLRTDMRAIREALLGYGDPKQEFNMLHKRIATVAESRHSAWLDDALWALRRDFVHTCHWIMQRRQEDGPNLGDRQERADAVVELNNRFERLDAALTGKAIPPEPPSRPEQLEAAASQPRSFTPKERDHFAAVLADIDQVAARWWHEIAPPFQVLVGNWPAVVRTGRASELAEGLKAHDRRCRAAREELAGLAVRYRGDLILLGLDIDKLVNAFGVQGGPVAEAARMASLLPDSRTKQAPLLSGYLRRVSEHFGMLEIDAAEVRKAITAQRLKLSRPA